MDGSASSDPEGRNLKYDWYTTSNTPAANSADIPADPSVLPNCNQSVLPAAFTPTGGNKAFTCVGGGVILNKALNAPITLWLRVTDAGQLSDLSNVVGGGCHSNADTGVNARSNLECQLVTPTG
jgi:hypothetical protein